MGKKGKGQPKLGGAPQDKTPKMASDPENYLKQTPVWRFSDFDWDGPWGAATCTEAIGNIRDHIELHLSSFETMTWADILKASGGRGKGGGTNSHPISRDKFKGGARKRLDDAKILADQIMSLRLDAGTRLYGVREGNCLRLLWFDPDHKDKTKCAYDFDA